MSRAQEVSVSVLCEVPHIQRNRSVKNTTPHRLETSVLSLLVHAGGQKKGKVFLVLLKVHTMKM